MPIWNSWHGCHKISQGCKNCYVYRRDESIGKDAGIVSKTGDFSLPIRKNRNGEYKLQPVDGTVYTCMTSDFFIEEADTWRQECWDMMKLRNDLRFVIITKRIDRFMQCVPDDWGEGYTNVAVFCTVENQEMADYRLPIFVSVPIKHRCICHEPMLGPVKIDRYLSTGKIERVICGGESGERARPCLFDWVMDIRDQCIRNNVSFHFKQTGAVFVKDGKTYHIERKLQESQAARAGIDYAAAADDEGDARNYRISREEWLSTDIFERLSKSDFRMRFKLKTADKEYINEKGMETIRSHAEEIISKRLAPADIPNDGKQTPMRGHPVFLAQHACACCCRGCLEKWHNIKPGVQLSENQQKYIVDTIMEWISRQI